MRRTIFALMLALAAARPGAADDDLGDLVLLTHDPDVNAALHQIGRVPLSTNTIGYDPCDDLAADRARKTGCAANGKIEHVVFIVLENHTFDNYYGRLNQGEERVPGADVATAANDAVQLQDGRTYRFDKTRFHLTEYCGWPDLAHGWRSIHGQVNGNKLDGYLVFNDEDSPVMGQFEYADMAYYYELARRFAIGDRVFASVATSSWPNHYYTVSGTSGGYIDNSLPVLQDDPSRLVPKADPSTGEVELSHTGHLWRTIFDSLEEGGVSWKIYMTNIAIPMAFSNFKKWVATGHVTTIAQYYADLAAGALPQVAYLAPGILVTDEHPGTGNFQRGVLQTASLVNALIASPIWGKSVMFLTYDDPGGWYDHVPVPRAYQPNDGCADDAGASPRKCVNGTWTPGAKAGYGTPLGDADRKGDLFDLLGARIPFMIVSPWVKRPVPGKGYASHHVYENVTILSFIEWRFGLPPLNTRTRAYKDGWRNPGCDWDLAKLDAAAGPLATDEVRRLRWSAALFDPFRTVRCGACPASDPFCAPPDPGRDEGLRAKVLGPGGLVPMPLAVAENRYLDPFLDPFDFAAPRPALLDGAQLVAGLPPPPVNVDEAVACPAADEPRVSRP